jgi:hypothetical protein
MVRLMMLLNPTPTGGPGDMSSELSLKNTDTVSTMAMTVAAMVSPQITSSAPICFSHFVR